MNHHNILRLVTAYEDPEEEVVIQITEFLSGGELFERILDSNEKLLESEIREYIRLVSGTRNVCLNLLDSKHTTVLTGRSAADVLTWRPAMLPTLISSQKTSCAPIGRRKGLK